jgi:benzoate-CoA ligase
MAEAPLPSASPQSASLSAAQAPAAAGQSGPLPADFVVGERFNLASFFLDRHAEQGSARIALRVGDELRTYGRLIERSRRVAAALRRARVRPEERVLLVLPDGFEYAESWFGILRAGAVFAMVNPLLPAEEFEYYARYTKARVAIVDGGLAATFVALKARVPSLEQVWAVGAQDGCALPYEEALGAEDPGSALAETEPTGPDDLAGWLFTSGSTGKPKACVHRQLDFAYNTETYARQVIGYRPEDICLGVPKLFFGYATGTNLMFPLRFGASAVLFPGRSTPDALFEQIERHRPTILTSVPTMIGQMLRSPRLESIDWSPLRAVLSAGEALPEELYREWKRRTGAEILDGIGSAEMFHIYISNRPGDVRPGSLGRLVPGYDAQIVGPSGEPLADGEPGRLRVRGGSTALCYWGDRQKSVETFQGEWCTSADIFRRDGQGYFFYEGRSDDLLKVSGIWVSPLEIENALLRHPAVAEVCVVGEEDQDRLVKPLAYVVLKSGQRGSLALADELKAHLKTLLAPHKYPRRFEWRESLPRNDRGKVARKQLAEEAQRR